MSGKIRQYIVDAFTDRPFAGNPAAVCVMESWPSEESMKKLAMENNLSETAFIVKEAGGYHLRWFTPGSEVELGVTYSPDFSIDGQYEFLMINGSQNNWYWPYEGASQQDANKVIITVIE